MARIFGIALLVLAIIIGAYYGLRSEPTFDLDRFDSMVARMRVGHRIAKRAADTDTIPGWLLEDRSHLRAIGAAIAAHDGDCAQTVQALEGLHLKYEQTQAQQEGRLSPEEIEELPGSKRNQLAHKIIFVLSPAYDELQEQTHEWCWQCTEESQILEKVLGTLASD